MRGSKYTDKKVLIPYNDHWTFNFPTVIRGLLGEVLAHLGSWNFDKRQLLPFFLPLCGLSVMNLTMCANNTNKSLSQIGCFELWSVMY